MWMMQSLTPHFLRRSSLRLVVGILAVVVSTLPLRAAEKADETVRLLTIGNSFANDALGFLPNLAKAGGKKLVVFRANLGGCSLDRHARHLAAARANPDATDTEARPYRNTGLTGLPVELKTVSLIDALKAQPWTHVTIQQVSIKSFQADTYEPYASEIVAAIREFAPQAEILVHQTWAYREDSPIYKKGDGFTPLKMYELSRANYHDLAKRHGGLRILPSGDAFHLARQSPRWTFKPDENFDYKNPREGALPDQRASLNTGWRWVKKSDGSKKFELDANHCNIAGKYLAGAAWYQVLFNTDEIPENFTPPQITPEDAADLRVHARAAVAGLYPALAGAK